MQSSSTPGYQKVQTQQTPQQVNVYVNSQFGSKIASNIPTAEEREDEIKEEEINQWWRSLVMSIVGSAVSAGIWKGIDAVAGKIRSRKATSKNLFKGDRTIDESITKLNRANMEYDKLRQQLLDGIGGDVNALTDEAQKRYYEMLDQINARQIDTHNHFVDRWGIDYKGNKEETLRESHSRKMKEAKKKLDDIDRVKDLKERGIQLEDTKDIELPEELFNKTREQINKMSAESNVDRQQYVDAFNDTDKNMLENLMNRDNVSQTTRIQSRRLWDQIKEQRDKEIETRRKYWNNPDEQREQAQKEYDFHNGKIKQGVSDELLPMIDHLPAKYEKSADGYKQYIKDELSARRDAPFQQEMFAYAYDRIDPSLKWNDWVNQQKQSEKRKPIKMTEEGKQKSTESLSRLEGAINSMPEELKQNSVIQMIGKVAKNGLEQVGPALSSTVQGITDQIKGYVSILPEYKKNYIQLVNEKGIAEATKDYGKRIGIAGGEKLLGWSKEDHEHLTSLLDQLNKATTLSEKFAHYVGFDLPDHLKQKNATQLIGQSIDPMITEMHSLSKDIQSNLEWIGSKEQSLTNFVNKIPIPGELKNKILPYISKVSTLSRDISQIGRIVESMPNMTSRDIVQEGVKFLENKAPQGYKTHLPNTADLIDKIMDPDNQMLSGNSFNKFMRKYDQQSMSYFDVKQLLSQDPEEQEQIINRAIQNKGMWWREDPEIQRRLQQADIEGNIKQPTEEEIAEINKLKSQQIDIIQKQQEITDILDKGRQKQDIITQIQQNAQTPEQIQTRLNETDRNINNLNNSIKQKHQNLQNAYKGQKVELDAYNKFLKDMGKFQEEYRTQRENAANGRDVKLPNGQSANDIDNASILNQWKMEQERYDVIKQGHESSIKNIDEQINKYKQQIQSDNKTLAGLQQRQKSLNKQLLDAKNVQSNPVKQTFAQDLDQISVWDDKTQSSKIYSKSELNKQLNELNSQMDNVNNRLRQLDAQEQWLNNENFKDLPTQLVRWQVDETFTIPKERQMEKLEFRRLGNQNRPTLFVQKPVVNSIHLTAEEMPKDSLAMTSKKLADKGFPQPKYQVVDSKYDIGVPLDYNEDTYLKLLDNYQNYAAKFEQIPDTGYDDLVEAYQKDYQRILKQSTRYPKEIPETIKISDALSTPDQRQAHKDFVSAEQTQLDDLRNEYNQKRREQNDIGDSDEKRKMNELQYKMTQTKDLDQLRSLQEQLNDTRNSFNKTKYAQLSDELSLLNDQMKIHENNLAKPNIPPELENAVKEQAGKFWDRKRLYKKHGKEIEGLSRSDYQNKKVNQLHQQLNQPLSKANQYNKWLNDFDFNMNLEKYKLPEKTKTTAEYLKQFDIEQPKLVEAENYTFPGFQLSFAVKEAEPNIDKQLNEYLKSVGLPDWETYKNNFNSPEMVKFRLNEDKVHRKLLNDGILFNYAGENPWKDYFQKDVRKYYKPYVGKVYQTHYIENALKNIKKLNERRQ